ncbi:hypothetical protein NL329_31030, partial [Klebsiella pneumoniae]|nr:hypothetical protein [Klebsiella pneumoniae]
EYVTVAVGRGADYLLGSPTWATVRIESDDVPELSLLGGGTVSEGGTASFTIVADQPLAKSTSVNYQISGSAQAGDDF